MQLGAYHVDWRRAGPAGAKYVLEKKSQMKKKPRVSYTHG